MNKRRLLVLVAVAAWFVATWTQARTENSTPILPQMPCKALLGQDFSKLPDAPTQLLSVEEIKEGGSSYCKVTGYTAPQIQFEVRLPLTSWTGRYLQLGCGGFCGS